AVELGALSADHLAGVSDAGIAALAASDTIAVLLPATLIFLGRRRQAPARRLLDAGAAVVGSDRQPRHSRVASPARGCPKCVASWPASSVRIRSRRRGVPGRPLLRARSD